jgi:hypothetical protein
MRKFNACDRYRRVYAITRLRPELIHQPLVGGDGRNSR